MADQTTTQNVISTQSLPDWYTTYLQQVMGRAVGAAGEPYQPYTGSTVARTTADQNQAYQSIRDIQGSQTPTLSNALNLYNQSAQGNSGAAGQGMFDAATGLFNQGAGADTAGMYQPYGQQASDFTYQAGQQAVPLIQQSTQPMGLSAASPYLQAASGSFPDAASAYMSPYTSAVTDRIAELGGRNLSENILPAISDDFVRAGQYGSTRQRDLVGRAARDTQDSILGQQAQALESGYSTAGQLYNADASRYAGLAGTAGGLGTQQQQITQQAGQTLGNLGLGQASSLSNIGATGAGLAGTDASRQISAGQGLSGIGQAQIQASQADLARQLAAAQGINGLATNANTMSLQNIAALENVGQSQQGQSQANLNALYNAFQQQQQYPWQVIGNLSNVIQGLPVNQSTSGTTTTTAPGPSTLGQVAGIGLGVAGLSNSGIFKAKGGAVRAPAKKKSRASYGVAPTRGLSFMRAA